MLAQAPAQPSDVSRDGVATPLPIHEPENTEIISVRKSGRKRVEPKRLQVIHGSKSYDVQSVLSI